MKWLRIAVLLPFLMGIICGAFLGLTSLQAQTPVRIHDLKSLTDSSGTDHLFYRIYEEYEGSEYYLNHIYHLDLQSGNEEIFLEDFYDLRTGLPFSVTIRDYVFLDSDIENYVFITRYCDNECSYTISRPGSVDLMGGLFVTMDHLNAEGTDSGRVYVEAFGKTIIGRNGGRDWPDADAETQEEIPDSSILGFPLVSLSPHDISLMFGRTYFNPDGENAFLRSNDGAITKEVISDTLLPEEIFFDSDRQTTYLVDRINAPGTTCTFETCDYGVYISRNLGESDSWVLKKVSDQAHQVFVHPIISGTFYLWNEHEIQVSSNYGESFQKVMESDEFITGFTVTENSGVFYSTVSAVYEITESGPRVVTSIPVSSEHNHGALPDSYLLNNYPNPFNPSTTIPFFIESAGNVQISIYTIQGKLVHTLTDKFYAQGYHEVQFHAQNLSSGTYIIKAMIGSQQQYQSITLVK